MLGSTLGLKSTRKLNRVKKCLEAQWGWKRLRSSQGLENAQKFVRARESPKTRQGITVSLRSILAKALDKILDRAGR